MPMGGGQQLLNPDFQYLRPGAMQGGAPKERTWSERLFYETGVSYGAGVIIGGGMGVYLGLQNAQGQHFKLKLNSVLNQ